VPCLADDSKRAHRTRPTRSLLNTGVLYPIKASQNKYIPARTLFFFPPVPANNVLCHRKENHPLLSCSTIELEIRRISTESLYRNPGSHQNNGLRYTYQGDRKGRPGKLTLSSARCHSRLTWRLSSLSAFVSSACSIWVGFLSLSFALYLPRHIPPDSVIQSQHLC